MDLAIDNSTWVLLFPVFNTFELTATEIDLLIMFNLFEDNLFGLMPTESRMGNLHHIYSE